MSRTCDSDLERIARRFEGSRNTVKRYVEAQGWVNPRTLRRDDAGRTITYPKHVHKALRRYLGIANTPGAQRVPFNNTEDFAFFG